MAFALPEPVCPHGVTAHQVVSETDRPQQHFLAAMFRPPVNDQTASFKLQRRTVEYPSDSG